MSKEPGLLNGVAEQVRQMREGILEQARKMQSAPLGVRRRTPQEEAALWSKMAGLPPEQFDHIMNAMAEKHGPTAVLAFMKKHAGRT